MRTYVGLASRPAFLLATAAVAACAAPHAVQETTPVAGPPQVSSLPPTVTFQADVAPIRAVTTTPDGAVWIGSDRGLRRVRFPAGTTEWVGATEGLVGRRVSALATDRSGRLLVATEVEVGRFTESGGRLRYQSIAKLPAVAQLAPATAAAPAAGDVAVRGAASSAAEGIWAGTANGLFFVHEAGASPSGIEGAQGIAITSLDVDGDGKSAWAGLAGQGVVQVDARHVLAAFGPAGSHAGSAAADALDFTDCLGTAQLPNGTRIAIGRGAQGRTHIVLLRRSGAELLTADVALPLLAVIARPPANGAVRTAGPLLLAGSAAAPRAYHLELAERGQVAGAGLIRFTPPRKNLQSLRLVARADSRILPADITVAVLGSSAAGARQGGTSGPDGLPGDDDQTFLVGTRALGVVRSAGDQPEYLPAGELAFGARGLSVACLERERCVFATGAGPGWVWDGGDRVIKPIPDGAIGGGLMALAGDGRSNVYFVASGAGKVLNIARLSSDGARWEPLLTLPVDVEGTPTVTFASLSPQGNLWMSLRDRNSSGQEFGRGVLEIQLPAGRAIHHRPYRQGEPHSPEALPIAGDVTAIRFQKAATAADQQAVWFCTSLGVLRFVGGQLSHWGENDGLDSESCNDLELAPDGVVWVATAAGVSHFDGKGWRRLGSQAQRNQQERSSKVVASSRAETIPVAVRRPAWPTGRDGDDLGATALVTSGDALWAGTVRGLWPVSARLGPAATAPAGQPALAVALAGGVPVGTRALDRTTGLVDDDIVDLTTDRFGRLWVLGHIGLTIRRPQTIAGN